MSLLKKISLIHLYRGYVVHMVFYWAKTSDTAPSYVHIVEDRKIKSSDDYAVRLTGPWADFLSALVETVTTADRYIDSQLDCR